MGDKTDRVPSVVQVRGLIAALDRFLHADEENSCPQQWWRQEIHRLDGFIGLAAALRPLRELTAVRGWPEWVQPGLLDVIKAVVGAFDLVTRSWGWELLARPGQARITFIRERFDAFSRRQLVTIRDVARECSKRVPAIECPPEVYRLAAAVPPIDTPPWFPGLDYDARLAPLRDALRAKDKACRLGSRFPTLDPNDPEADPKAVAAAGLLRRALVQLRAAVAEVDPVPRVPARPDPPKDPRNPVAELREAGHPVKARLVEFMADKRFATVDEVAEAVHGDAEASDDTVSQNAIRTTDWLQKHGYPLCFTVKGGCVYRKNSPGGHGCP
jgi:hypothetical protein